MRHVPVNDGRTACMPNTWRKYRCDRARIRHRLLRSQVCRWAPPKLLVVVLVLVLLVVVLLVLLVLLLRVALLQP